MSLAQDRENRTFICPNGTKLFFKKIDDEGIITSVDADSLFIKYIEWHQVDDFIADYVKKNKKPR